MSDIPILPSKSDGDSAFNPRLMIVIAAIGALAFIAMLVLGAYAPDLRSGENGGTHALSNSATGFSGLVRLAEATGKNPIIVRSLDALDNEDLAVITPDHGDVDLSAILEHRGPRTTLLVLPKWDTKADPDVRGWVRVSGLLPAVDPARTLYPGFVLFIQRTRGNRQALKTVQFGAPSDLQFLAPAIVQSMSNSKLEPMITDLGGRTILGKVKGRNFYILSDPDLINNHGMGNEHQARAALALLDDLNSTGSSSILFDVTANGLGRSQSPLKLAFDPPFVAVTLTIFAAMLLAAWQAAVRFGPVERRARAIAFGKAALVDNSAALIRKAGREPHLGPRYADLIRERVIALFHLPVTSDERTLDARIEALNPNRSFALAEASVREAGSRDELLSSAQSLNQWLEEAQR